MQDIAISDKDKIIMKLLHYFITEKGYNPVVVHGIKDEIWLENLNSDYKIIRIVSNYIHNNEQLNLDIFRTKRVLSSIKKKTLLLKMDSLSIFIDLGDNVKLNDNIDNMDFISVDEEKDLENSEILKLKFPDLNEKMKYDADGMDLFIKLTTEINKNREEENSKVENLFKERKPILTPILLILNLIIFLTAQTFNNSFLNTMFYDKNIYYLVVGMFSLYLLGTKVEGFYGAIKTLIIYLFTSTCGALLGLKLGINSGYIAPVFGFIGAVINLGSYYRVYLTSVLKTLILPVVIVNIIFLIVYNYLGLAIVAVLSLISGFLISRALEAKSIDNKTDSINGYIMSTIMLVALIVINYI